MHSLKFLFGAMFSLALLAPASPGASYYVDSRTGNDAGAGTQQAPFKTVQRAIQQVDGVGGEVNLAAGSGPYRENIVIRKGGLAEAPLILDGHGAVINIGEEVTRGPWTDTGNGWVLEKPVAVNDRYYVASPVFVNGLPVFSDHPKGLAPGAWHGGSVRYDEQNRLVLVFPKGLTPANSVIVLTGGDKMTCCVSLSGASNVRLRNLTAAFASNDGFNFHGKGENVTVEGCKALFNGDQGVSAHETYVVAVHDTEIAFNGTRSGGVTDIGSAVTTYQNVRIHQNRGPAFTLSGARHLLDHVVSFGNPGGNLPKPSATIELVDCEDQGPVAADATVPVVEPGAKAADKPAETDRLNRFLQFRPSAEPVHFNK